MLSKGNGFQKVIGQLFSYKTKRGRDTKRQNGGAGGEWETAAFAKPRNPIIPCYWALEAHPPFWLWFTP